MATTVAIHHACRGSNGAAGMPGSSGGKPMAGASMKTAKPARPQNKPWRHPIACPRRAKAAISRRANAVPVTMFASRVKALRWKPSSGAQASCSWAAWSCVAVARGSAAAVGSSACSNTSAARISGTVPTCWAIVTSTPVSRPANAAANTRLRNMAMLDSSASVAGEGRGVPRIVRRIVQRLDVGEADAEQQEHAEQRGEQGRTGHFGPRPSRGALGDCRAELATTWVTLRLNSLGRWSEEGESCMR